MRLWRLRALAISCIVRSGHPWWTLRRPSGAGVAALCIQILELCAVALQVTPVLQRIFGKSGYVCAGAGGDFVLPNTYEYQPLHVDLDFPGCQQQSASPVVTLNVPLLPLTWENGPTKLSCLQHLLLQSCLGEAFKE